MIQAVEHRSEEAAAEIHGIFQRSYKKEAELLGLDSIPPLHRTRDQLRTASTSFLGCLVEKKLAAVLEFNVKGAHLAIDSLVVDPSHFRQGLASALLKHLLTQEKWFTAEVETASGNVPAIALYRRFGFRESKVWRTSHGIEKVKLTARAS